MTHRRPCVPVWSDWTEVSVAENSSLTALTWLLQRVGGWPSGGDISMAPKTISCAGWSAGPGCLPGASVTEAAESCSAVVMLAWCCLPSARAVPLVLVQRDVSARSSRGVRVAPRTGMEV